MTITVKNGLLLGSVKHQWSTRADGEKDKDGKFINDAVRMKREIVFDGMPLNDAITAVVKTLVIARQKVERESDDLEGIAKDNGKPLLWSEMGTKVKTPEQIKAAGKAAYALMSKEEKLAYIKELQELTEAEEEEAEEELDYEEDK